MTPIGLLMIRTVMLAVAVAVPVGIGLFVQEISRTLYAGMAVWVTVWAVHFGRALSEKAAAMWRNDCIIFSAVVRQLRNDDPILANAVWQKTHPKIPPPWVTAEDNSGKPVAQ